MTKTHVIDGKTYVEVERKAKVGEKVVIVDNSVFSGSICDVQFDYPDGGISVDISNVNLNYFPYIHEDEYRVLAEVGEEPSAPESTEDIIANLVRRVASLEQQLRDTQNNVERQGVEIAEVAYGLKETARLTESHGEDIRFLDERTQPKNPSSESVTIPKWLFEGMVKHGGARG